MRSGSSEATAAAAGGAIVHDPVRFPSRRWFERLAALMKEDRARHSHLGDIDCVAVFTVLDGGPGGAAWSVQLTFEEFEVVDVREAGEAEMAAADFIAETELATWREMIESIAAGRGRPDLAHTLNYLSLPGTPIRLWSEDPIGRDKFFRFNQTLQEFFNASARFATVFPGAPAS